jgi:hypothetical protein
MRQRHGADGRASGRHSSRPNPAPQAPLVTLCSWLAAPQWTGHPLRVRLPSWLLYILGWLLLPLVLPPLALLLAQRRARRT